MTSSVREGQATPRDAPAPAHVGWRERFGAPAEPTTEIAPPEKWSNLAFWFPILAVLAAWGVSHWLSEWIIRCDGMPWLCGAGGSFEAVRMALLDLDFTADRAVRTTHDLALRFAWHPTLVAFVVVALGTVLAAWYLIHKSFKACLTLTEGRTAALHAGVALGAAALLWVGLHYLPQWVIRTEILTPILEAALGTESGAPAIAEWSQRVFQTLALTGGAFVVAAAASALLVPWKRTGFAHPSATLHLTDQWRRLSFTLYAGAMLLAAAVVHQTALYGWANAFMAAATESREAVTRGRATSLDSARRALAIAKARVADDSIRSVFLRLGPRAVHSGQLDTARRLAQRDPARVHALAASTYRVDSIVAEIQHDSLAATAAVRHLSGTMTRVSALVGTAIMRGGGLVYTVLLAVMYLPGALVLMERARELSRAQFSQVTDTEQDRAEWRSKNGIAFSLGTQWSKFLAVLMPLLASGGAAYVFGFFK